MSLLAASMRQRSAITSGRRPISSAGSCDGSAIVASATAEGYEHAAEGRAEPAPYHGYFFRILTAQGKNAPGGARSYVKDGKMTGGFALVAWPADHGSSGVMTFIVGEQDVVYQKDLGEGTAEAVKAITTFDPDRSWDATR